ncbi:FAD-dependent oxidoreductase [Actinocorallia sp. B10E7]|uniref:NAD(P)/FAD-dependent oxidoreductase n=1 Tax=Actinocorallia sp. B10E7 TaxID=3153558 RepID=UPI00325E855C
MAALESHVIIGAGPAGAKAAETLREEGFTGGVLLVGKEPERPYERPPLSKKVLLGQADPESVYLHEESWYRDRDITLLTDTAATALDREARKVSLADGSELRYDRLLLATGSSPRRLRVPGTALDGVRTLRTLADARALHGLLRGGDRRVVVVGAGWIGLEVAAAARQYGNRVTLVEAEATPLYCPLGPEAGKIFADLHRSKGVECVFEDGLFAIRGEGSVDHVLTSRGVELPADLVVLAVGVVPEDGLARAAGLRTDNGVVVDSALRTEDPRIFAAGDVACFYHPLYRRHLRVEHWANALGSGSAAARSMLGRNVSYDRIPYYFTDQYELSMEFSGHADPGSYDRVVVRGDVSSGAYLVFWLSGDHLVAAMSVNTWEVTDILQFLIRSGTPVDPDALSEPRRPLAGLIAG